MEKQARNLNPHKPAKVAMWLYGREYSLSGAGSMDFWDGLSEAAKANCRRLVSDIEGCRAEFSPSKKPKLNLDNKPHFNGPEYEPERDKVRLTGQIKRVFNCMSDGNWRTLDQINAITGDPHASISAQLRHLRKPRFGSHTVERKHIKNGFYKYRLIVNQQDAEQLSLV